MPTGLQFDLQLLQQTHEVLRFRDGIRVVLKARPRDSAARHHTSSCRPPPPGSSQTGAVGSLARRPAQCQIVLQAVPSLHQMRFAPARHCVAAIAVVLGARNFAPSRAALRNILPQVLSRSMTRIPWIAGSGSSSAWRVRCRTSCSPVLLLSVVPPRCRPPPGALPPRHPQPAVCCSCGVWWRAEEGGSCETVMCLSGSPLPMTSCVSPTVAQHLVSHTPAASYSSFFRTSSISSSMTGVSANFRRSSAQATRPQFAPALRLLIRAGLRPPFVECDHPDAGPKLHSFIAHRPAQPETFAVCKQFGSSPATS